MKKQQKKALKDEAACRNEWSGSAGRVPQQGHVIVLLENTLVHLTLSVCKAVYLK